MQTPKFRIFAPQINAAPAKCHPGRRPSLAPAPFPPPLLNLILQWERFTQYVFFFYLAFVVVYVRFLWHLYHCKYRPRTLSITGRTTKMSTAPLGTKRLYFYIVLLVNGQLLSARKNRCISCDIGWLHSSALWSD